MPIQFACPRCSRLLSIATRKAGMVVVCPKCSQRITVPTPPSDKPLPGILLAPVIEEPVPSGVDSESDVPTLVEEPEVERQAARLPEPAPSASADDYDPFPIRRRRKTGASPVALLGLGILTLAALIMVVIAIKRHDRITSAGSEASPDLTGSAQQCLDGFVLNLEQILDANKTGNAIREKDRQAEFERVLAALRGKPIKWVVIVQSVDVYGEVSLQPFSKLIPGAHTPCTLVLARAEETDWNKRIKFPTDPKSTRANYAGSLSAGDKVVLIGTIEVVEGKDSGQWIVYVKKGFITHL